MGSKNADKAIEELFDKAEWESFDKEYEGVLAKLKENKLGTDLDLLLEKDVLAKLAGKVVDGK